MSAVFFRIFSSEFISSQSLSFSASAFMCFLNVSWTFLASFPLSWHSFFKFLSAIVVLPSVLSYHIPFPFNPGHSPTISSTFLCTLLHSSNRITGPFPSSLAQPSTNHLSQKSHPFHRTSCPLPLRSSPLFPHPAHLLVAILSVCSFVVFKFNLFSCFTEFTPVST